MGEILWVEDAILHYTKGVLFIQKSMSYLSNPRCLTGNIFSFFC